MNFELNSEEQELAKTVREGVDERVESRTRKIDGQNRIPEEPLTDAVKLGLLGFSFPEEYREEASISRQSSIVLPRLMQNDDPEAAVVFHWGW